MKTFTSRKSRTRLLSLLMAVLLLAGLAVVPASASSAPVLPNGWYVIYTANGTTCLNVQYAQKNGAGACVDTANLESNEIWQLTNVGYGWVTLSPKHAPNHYLSANGFDKQLVLRQGVPSAAAQWKPIAVGGGKYVFQNRANPSCVIDCRCGENTKAGNPFLLYTRNGFEAAQSLIPVQISTVSALTPGTRVTNLASGYYKVGLYYNRNQVLNAQYGAKAGAFIVCDGYNGELNEILYISRETSSGLYSLRFAANTNLCIAPSSILGDRQMTVKTYDGTNSCLFELYKVGSTYCFRSAATGLMIDDYCCQTAAGTKIIGVPYNQCAAQQFYLDKVAVNTASVSLKVPSYKQYDSRWGSQKISTRTLSDIGCMVTSAAMVYSYRTGSTVYPNTMMGKLSFSGNNLYWSSLTKLGFSTSTYSSSMTNSIMKTIYTQLKAGRPVIIGAERSAGNAHYVVITGYTGTSTTSFSASQFTINDPNSTSRTTLAQFLATYSRVIRLVY